MRLGMGGDDAGQRQGTAQRSMRNRRSTARRALAVVMAGALAVSALVFAGCGSAQSSSGSDPKFDVSDIEVSKSGYTLDDDGSLRYAFVATNPNAGHLAKNVVFSIEAYDDDNRMVAGAGVTIPLMYPDHEEAACGSAQVYESAEASSSAASEASGTPEVSYIRITPVMDSVEWADTSYDGAAIEEALSIDHTSMSAGADGAISVSAQVSTTFDRADLLAVALLFDADGNPVCGSDGLSFECSKDSDPSSLALEIPNAPRYESCYIYVSPQSEL